MLMWSYWQTEPFESCSGIGSTLKVFGSSSRWYLTKMVRNVSIRKQERSSKALCLKKITRWACLEQWHQPNICDNCELEICIWLTWLETKVSTVTSN
jgi:hypothetical protein